MTISDSVAGNLTTIYVLVIAGIKAHGTLLGRTHGGAYILALSTALVAAALAASLAWDVARKATRSTARARASGGVGSAPCRGGICWHGVAVSSPASQVRFRLPPPHDRM